MAPTSLLRKQAIAQRQPRWAPTDASRKTEQQCAREINTLPASTRAIAGSQYRHFWHQKQIDPHAGAPAGQIGAGAHTDYGNVTLLATDGVAGLQVRRRDGTWFDAPALPGALICNIGDCLMRWTNDVYVSTPHRELKPAAEWRA